MLDFTIFSIEDKFKFTFLNLLIFFLIWLLAKAARKHVKPLVHRFFKSNVIRVGDRELATLTIVRQIINVLAIILALESLSVNNQHVGFAEILEFEFFRIKGFHVSTFNLLLLAALIITARIITNSIRIMVFRAIKDERENYGRAYTVVMLSQYFIYTVFLVIAIQSFGIDITILIASSAALFVGLGLGLQKIFADIVSGFILLFEGNIKIGDIVQVDDSIAKVTEINIRTSKVKTLDGNFLIIPNSKLTSENLNNRSFNKKSTRYHIEVNTSYGTDPEKVRELLYNCALQHPMVDKTRPIQVFLEDFGDSGLKFKLLYWTENVWEHQRIQSDLRFLVEKNFRNNNIRIPYPQREIHVKEKSSLE